MILSQSDRAKILSLQPLVGKGDPVQGTSQGVVIINGSLATGAGRDGVVATVRLDNDYPTTSYIIPLATLKSLPAGDVKISRSTSSSREVVMRSIGSVSAGSADSKRVVAIPRVVIPSPVEPPASDDAWLPLPISKIRSIQIALKAMVGVKSGSKTQPWSGTCMVNGDVDVDVGIGTVIGGSELELIACGAETLVIDRLVPVGMAGLALALGLIQAHDPSEVEESDVPECRLTATHLYVRREGVVVSVPIQVHGLPRALVETIVKAHCNARGGHGGAEERVVPRNQLQPVLDAVHVATQLSDTAALMDGCLVTIDKSNHLRIASKVPIAGVECLIPVKTVDRLLSVGLVDAGEGGSLRLVVSGYGGRAERVVMKIGSVTLLALTRSPGMEYRV